MNATTQEKSQPISNPVQTPVSLREVLDALNTRWGYPNFRALQGETVEAILNARDSLTLLPTGGGKSLCYQLPITFFPGRTALIVSPLIALMEDQVKQAQARGYRAASLNSSQAAEARRETFEAYRSGALQLLYVSPERLQSPAFIEALQTHGQLAYIAIDEAHCISQWGHQFRPDYQRLGELRRAFPQVGMHAFTATATQAVARDIMDSLALEDALCFRASMFRANLEYRVEERETRFDDFLEMQLLPQLQRLKQRAGIIYTSSRANVEKLATLLQANGLKVKPYHAGLPHALRQKNQEAFMHGEASIMVATVAFGMGIDRGDLGFVIHTHAPPSLEHYVQEAGRAGRNGEPAQCLLYFNSRDFFTWEDRLKNELSGEAHQAGIQRLWEMQAYAESLTCRHRQMMGYFAQRFLPTHCTGCDVCQREPAPFTDSALLMKHALSSVWRLKNRASVNALAGVLLGEAALLPGSLREEAQGWRSYAAFSEESRDTVMVLIEQLIRHAYLRESEVESGGGSEAGGPALGLTAIGQQWLKAASQQGKGVEAPALPVLYEGARKTPRLSWPGTGEKVRPILPNACPKPKPKRKKQAPYRKR